MFLRIEAKTAFRDLNDIACCVSHMGCPGRCIWSNQPCLGVMLGIMHRIATRGRYAMWVASVLLTSLVAEIWHVFDFICLRFLSLQLRLISSTGSSSRAQCSSALQYRWSSSVYEWDLLHFLQIFCWAAQSRSSPALTRPRLSALDVSQYADIRTCRQSYSGHCFLSSSGLGTRTCPTCRHHRMPRC